ncbi:MAG: TfoX/Sxy family protein [Pseudomonadota bacterium]|uniref:TfoX/Sxy family protein n=1 Tax=Phenylobacterium sp. TaxID=1871053 RepID=UPI0025FCAE75|nr:TfoX/Sxy family protein [Phenylobacterium sp.]MBT9471250.1 TfoX/Sxy family protein [Phenylobacterium sp.]
MSVSPDFLDYVLEQLSPLGGITHRRMFGGVGVSRHDLFFALIADDGLYFKADEVSRPDFEAAGCEPFKPFGGDKAMSYWSVPLDALEDPDEMRVWSTRALDAALRAKAPKSRKR